MNHLINNLEEAGDHAAAWQRDRLPVDAIPIERELPPEHAEVLGWVSDADIAIHFFPVVIRRDGNGYWAGLPAKWIDLKQDRWTVCLYFQDLKTGDHRLVYPQ